MRRVPVAISAVCVAALTQIASAADLGQLVYKAPPPAPPPVYSWTGWYVGGNVGYGWGSASNDFAFFQTTANTTESYSFNGSEHDRLDGVIGGAQAGYYLQSGIYLYGIEADIQGSAEKHTDTFSGSLIPNSVSNGANPFTSTETNKIDWFGTARGRVGITTDHWLFYATGGLAYGRVGSSGILQPLNSNPAITNSPFLWDDSATKVGWVIGAGIEKAFFGDWSWKVEYLYMDLGKTSSTASGGAHNCYSAPGPEPCHIIPDPVTGSVTSHFADNIVRVGLNYQFR